LNIFIGVRMLDGVVNDAVEARALGLNPEHIDIYSASWGPEDDGKTVDGPGPLARRAFIYGVTSGRKGKGSIFVWASGNGGRHTDSCNCDGYTNSIFTLSISSATQGGYKPWYLEECSSTLATTYSSGTPGHDKSVATVDMDARLRPDHICTVEHTGTSASAPLAAGICALALEANPSLTWRDLQYLVVLTSRPTPLEKESGWIVNGVRRKVSHKFGYGLMDAGALVTLAEKWTTVPPQHICKSQELIEDRQIQPAYGTTLDFFMDVDACSGTLNEVRFLEHVQCKISLRTCVSSCPPRSYSDSQGICQPCHEACETCTGPDQKSCLTCSPGHVRLIDLDICLQQCPAGYYENFADKTCIPCQPNCAGCQDRPDHCTSCDHHLLLYQNRCLAACPTNTYETEDYGCTGCHESCETCKGSNSSQCISCLSGHFWHEGRCVKECPAHHYADTHQRECIECPPGCSECNKTTCISCLDDWKVNSNGRCVSQNSDRCDVDQYFDSGLCKPCHSTCDSCDGPTEKACLSCANPFILQGTRCVGKCDKGFYNEKDSQLCEPCLHTCSRCVAKTNCSECKVGLQLQSGECRTSCATGYYSDKGMCMRCYMSCKTCSGPGQDQCVSCPNGWQLLSGECRPDCPEGYYKTEYGCQKCHYSCRNCAALALAAVKSGSMKLSDAARRFDVPKSTIHNKIKEKVPNIRKMGPAPVLSTAEEDRLQNWILSKAKLGFPMHPKKADQIDESVWKEHMHWPKQGVESKKRTKRESMPFAITSGKWIEFQQEQERKKTEKEENIRKRKLDREQKKVAKEAKKPKTKTKTKKTKIKSPEKGSPSGGYNIGDYVVVNYEGANYPGLIKNVRNTEYEISVLHKTTKNRWKWPTPADQIWYQAEEVRNSIQAQQRGYNRVSIKKPKVTCNYNVVAVSDGDSSDTDSSEGHNLITPKPQRTAC
ncbi:hypothetical protein NQ314_004447, partial [Rhamnusium bicolor]